MLDSLCIDQAVENQWVILDTAFVSLKSLSVRSVFLHVTPSSVCVVPSSPYSCLSPCQCSSTSLYYFISCISSRLFLLFRPGMFLFFLSLLFGHGFVFYFSLHFVLAFCCYFLFCPLAHFWFSLVSVCLLKLAFGPPISCHKHNKHNSFMLSQNDIICCCGRK